MVLDFKHASIRERAGQMSTVRLALLHTQEEVPLVLHLRGAREDTSRIVRVSVKRQCVTRWYHAYTIHVYCFPDGIEEYRTWRNDYTRLCFGFTRLVTNFKPEQILIIREIRGGDILLESYVPYFPPPLGNMIIPNILAGYC